MTPPAGEAAFAHVFEAVAIAVADAQSHLDDVALRLAMHRVFPRFDTDVRFRVQIDAARKVLLIFRLEGRSSHATNRLCFSLFAIPTRPVPPDLAPPVEIAIPPYLLPAEQEQAIGEQMERFAGGTIAAPPGEDTGLVCFRLTDPVRYFIARVNEDPRKDKIHNFYPEVPQRVNFPRNQDKKTWLYSPFGDLFAALRAAQRDASLVPYAYTPGTDLAWGWDRFDEIVRDLWRSYRKAMEELAARQPVGDQPVFYRIDNIRGEFFFSEWTSKSPDHALDNVFDAEDDWIHNLVVLRQDSRLSAARIELQHAEFVVAGDARGRLLDMIGEAKASEAIAHECQKRGPVDAAEFRGAPADALILLSYDRRPPDKGFLALWPAMAGDFLFTFDSDGEALKGTPKVRAFIPMGPRDLVTIDDDAYEEIHNFFRAIRLWRTRKPRTSD